MQQLWYFPIKKKLKKSIPEIFLFLKKMAKMEIFFAEPTTNTVAKNQQHVVP